MEEDIKILEEFIEDYNACYPEEKEWVAIYPNQIQAIENLIARNEELEEAIDVFMKGKGYSTKQLENINKNINKNYIPKSKAKEKQIKENEIRRNRFLYGNYECPSESYKYKYTDIDMNDYAGMEVNRVLQELLED